MTLKEEAYALIEKLPDKVMGDIVQMLKRTVESPLTWETPEQSRMKKMEALLEIQQLRRDARRFGSMDYATAREEAMFEKYGV